MEYLKAYIKRSELVRTRVGRITIIIGLKNRGRLATAVIAVLVCVVVSSCYAPNCSSALTVENRSTAAVTLFEDSNPSKVIDPNTKREFAIYKFDGMIAYSLRSQAGDVLASETFTFQDMLNRDGLTLVAD